MELDELGVLQGDACSESHGVAITRACVRRCAREVRATIASCGEHGVVGTDTVDSAVFHVYACDTHASTILHDEVQSEVLDEVSSVKSQRATV